VEEACRAAQTQSYRRAALRAYRLASL
jgi:hypothetical protein